MYWIEGALVTQGCFFSKIFLCIPEVKTRNLRLDEWAVQVSALHVALMPSLGSATRSTRFDTRQGSLVGMIAAKGRADAFVSLAGAGQEIDDVIVDQIEKQSPGLKDNARSAFDDLRANGIAVQYSPYLASIFRASLQPFLISWMKYDPQEELSKLEMPVLIVNGDKDLQVQISEAEKLHKAKPGADFKIIQGMNHIFRNIEGDDLDNQKTYNNPSLPIMPELVDVIAAFINP